MFYSGKRNLMSRGGQENSTTELGGTSYVGKNLFTKPLDETRCEI